MLTSLIIDAMSANVGSELRRIREQRNEELQTVADALHIRTLYLQAIENGRSEVLPSVAQGRGFVRLYADYLGLNVADVLTAWDDPKKSYPLPVDAGSVVIRQAEYTQPRPPTMQDENNSLSKTAIKSSDSKEIYKKIGTVLRYRRERLQLSFEDCESQTMVREKYLQAMENGDFELLPSSIQSRGLLNNYASFLNLDLDEVMGAFAEALQNKNKTTPESITSILPEQKKANVKTAGKVKRFFTPDLFVALIVLTGMVAIILYSAVTISKYRTIAQSQLDEVGLSLADDEFIQNPRETAVPPTATPDLRFLIQNNANNSEQEVEQTNNNPVQIIIQSSQRTYLSVSADGREVFNGRTLPGYSYPFDALNLITIKCGNAAALSITYNQEKLGTIGKLGEAVTIGFSRNMVMTPTPRFSPTPSQTYEPTYTPAPVLETPIPTITPYIP